MNSFTRVLAALLLCVATAGFADEDIATVVVEGIGKDVESATRQAAEAALTQVVGSGRHQDTVTADQFQNQRILARQHPEDRCAERRGQRRACPGQCQG